MLKGESVVLLTPTISYDENKDEVLTYTEQTIDNVLFGQPETSDIDEVMRLYSVELSWVLAIPKTFEGTLRDCLITRQFDGVTYRVIGNAEPYHPNIMKSFPGNFPWNRRARVVMVDG